MLSLVCQEKYFVGSAKSYGEPVKRAKNRGYMMTVWNPGNQASGDVLDALESVNVAVWQAIQE